MKKNKRKKKVLKRIKTFAVLLLIGGAIVFAMMSPIFNITEINVVGNNKIDKEEIINLSGINIGENIFKNRTNVVSKNIKEEKYIESVKIKRKLPSIVEITVTEREAAYQARVLDSYIYIDYQGYILEKTSNEGDFPILEGIDTSQDELLNGVRLCREDITHLNTIYKIVENAKNIDIYSIISKIIIDNNNYILYFKDENKYAYLGNDNDIVNKMLFLKTILQEEKEKMGNIYVDSTKPRFREENIFQENTIQENIVQQNNTQGM